MAKSEVLGLCNFKCYHYTWQRPAMADTVLGLCNFKCYHYTIANVSLAVAVLGLCNFKCYHYRGIAYKRTKDE